MRVGWVPVHGQLSHQSDVSVVLAGRVLVLQEVQVHSVNRESLPTEVVALIVLVELLQSRLQLRRRTRRGSKNYFKAQTSKATKHFEGFFQRRDRKSFELLFSVAADSTLIINGSPPRSSFSSFFVF